MNTQVIATLAVLAVMGGVAHQARADANKNGSCSAKIKVSNARDALIYVHELEVKSKGNGWTGVSAEGAKYIEAGKSKTWDQIDFPVLSYGLMNKTNVKFRAVWSVADKKGKVRSTKFFSNAKKWRPCGKGLKQNGRMTVHQITIENKKNKY